MRVTWFVVFVVVSFTLHLAWETFHLPLYGGYEHLSPYLPISVWASIVDVLYVVSAVLFASFVKGNTRWVTKPRWNDFVGLVIIGFFIAAYVEYKALAFGKWHYLETMPVIPWLEVGLSPVAQMTILLPLGVYLTSFLLKNLIRYK